jgi:hypothetical protein
MDGGEEKITELARDPDSYKATKLLAIISVRAKGTSLSVIPCIHFKPPSQPLSRLNVQKPKPPVPGIRFLSKHDQTPERGLFLSRVLVFPKTTYT